LVDVCSTVSVSSMASLLDRPYAKADSGFKTVTASGCNYEGADGLSSLLDLNLAMQTGATRADLTKALKNLAEASDHPAQLSGVADYAAGVKDVVAALFGHTIIADDSNHPTSESDLTPAQLKQVVRALASAVR
jgi:hypothetical protein